MLDRLHWRLLVLIAVIAAAAGYGLHRSGMLTRASIPDAEALSRAQAIRHGQTVYRTISHVPLSELQGEEDYRVVLAKATVKRGTTTTDADTQRLLEHAAGFLHKRFGQASVAEYRRWRVDRGYRLISAEEARRDGVARRYPAVTGKPYPGDENIDSVFDELWIESSRYGDLPTKPRAIAAEPKGLALVYGRISKRDPAGWPMPAGGMAEEDWRGAGGGGHENWWVPVSFDGGAMHHLRTIGWTDVACFGVVVEMGRDERYPLRLMFWKNSTDGKWWLEGLQIFNADVSRLTMLDY